MYVARCCPCHSGSYGSKQFVSTNNIDRVAWERNGRILPTLRLPHSEGGSRATDLRTCGPLTKLECVCCGGCVCVCVVCGQVTRRVLAWPGRAAGSYRGSVVASLSTKAGLRLSTRGS
jgi:hypothetical protein